MTAAVRRPRIRLVAAVLGLAALLPVVGDVAPAHGASQECPRFGDKTTNGTIRADAVKEASGLVASRTQSSILWTHNDSGGRNEIFAINKKGALQMTVRFGTVNVRDFEDISIGPGPGSGDYIYAADIGDNGVSRDTVRIYRFREPQVTSGTITLSDSKVETFEYRYERSGGGTESRNSESLAVDPRTGDVVIVEKHHATRSGISRTSRFYRLKQSELVEGKVLTAKIMTWARTSFEGTARPPAAAEFSADGRMLVVKNGYEVFAWLREPGQSIYSAIGDDRVTDCLYRGAVGEAVAVTNTALFFVREGRDSPVEKTEISIPQATLKCGGLPVTIVGTGGADTIKGTTGPDVIHAKGGNDRINGRGGGDVICGGAGDDVIDGGPGADRLFGSVGNDRLLGSIGADRIKGGAGHDVLVGGDTGDRLFGEAGDDTLYGGAGFDQLSGGSGTDLCKVGPDGGEIIDC